MFPHPSKMVFGLPSIILRSLCSQQKTWARKAKGLLHSHHREIPLSSFARYKYYERWATANDFPVDNIINDGSTVYENRLALTHSASSS